MFEGININENNVLQMSPMTWAYVGDSIYEIYVRTYLVKTKNVKPGQLHKEAIKYVKASAQANILRQIEDKLTEEEKDIVRRTRNTKPNTIPKNANISDYMHATAFEGLIGYLFLMKKYDRIEEIMLNILL